MSKNVLSHNLVWLDVIRLISILLVLYAHWVIVGSYATEISGIIPDSMTLPLITDRSHDFSKFEVFLVENFKTQSGVLGVVLFFIVTGYLMPSMMERYTRKNFLINRSFRIFPALIFSTLCIGSFLYFCVGIQFNFINYLMTWSLLFSAFGMVAIMGVVWTLLLEVAFYLMSALIGKFSLLKLLALYCFVFILLGFEVFYGMSPFILLRLYYPFLMFIFIGSAIWLSHSYGFVLRVCIVFFAFFLSFILFQIHKNYVGSVGTYETLGTHFLAGAIFLSAMFLGRMGILRKIPKVAVWFADLVYPIYLLNASIGLAAISVARNYFNNGIMLIFVAFSSTLLLAYITHIVVERPFIKIGRYLSRKS